jgi:hypothetical protein
MSQADMRRLDRLVGDKGSEAGIDLASLFRVILDQVQDNADGVTADALMAPVMSGVSNHARVEHWYREKLPGADPWKALLADALDQLERRQFLAGDGGRWRRGPRFATGKRLVVVPERKGRHGSVGVIVHEVAEREALGAAEQQRMEVSSLAAMLREDGPGLRALDNSHVSLLEQSMRDYGYRAEFPVLVDQHGRVLDGRHRIAAARRAGISEPLPRREVRVGSDEEAVGFAFLVNFQRGWTTAERNRINSDLQAAGLTLENYGHHLGPAAKRELIKTALLENPQLTHRAIAKRLGLHPEQVNRVCGELMTQCVISECQHRLTEDGKQAPGQKPKPPAPAEERIEELLLENPQQSNKQIMAEVGLPDNNHRVVERVRSRMEEAGTIPSAPVRQGSDGTARHVPHASPAPVLAPHRPAAPAPTPAADEDSGALDQMVTLFRKFTAKSKTRLVARLLRELSDEERAEVYSEVGR